MEGLLSMGPSPSSYIKCLLRVVVLCEKLIVLADIFYSTNLMIFFPMLGEMAKKFGFVRALCAIKTFHKSLLSVQDSIC